MSVLGGDTFFNRWSVPLIPYGKMVKCKSDDHHALFRDGQLADVHMEPDEHTISIHEELNLAAGKDEMIPFPQEHNLALGQEMLNVFQSEILVVLKPGSGEMLKAALLKHVWSIAIVKNQTHKDEIAAG